MLNLSNMDRILAAMSSGVPMTAHEIAEASGVPMGTVATYMPRICMADRAKCVSRKRPMQYQLTGAPAEPIAAQAARTAPNSVFDLARVLS